MLIELMCFLQGWAVLLGFFSVVVCTYQFFVCASEGEFIFYDFYLLQRLSAKAYYRLLRGVNWVSFIVFFLFISTLAYSVGQKICGG